MGKFVTVVTLNNDSSYCIIGMVFVIHSKKKFIGGLYMGQKLSAMKYVKNNKRRIAVLVVSLALSFMLTYLTNFLLLATEETCRVCAVYNMEKIQYAYLTGSTLGIDVDNVQGDEFNEQYREKNLKLSEALRKYDGVNETYYTQVLFNYIDMSFGSWGVQIPLMEKDDISAIFEHWGIKLAEGRMPENAGEIVLDKAAMSNGGYVCGNYFEENQYEKAYKIVGVLESDRYIGYGIQNPEKSIVEMHMILSDGSIDNLSRLLELEGINTKIGADNIFDVEHGQEDVQINITNAIGTSTTIIYVVITVIMFLSLYIVYTMYLRDRHNEWCLYCSIGFSRKEIYKAIMRELLFTIGLAIVVGIAITVIGAFGVDKLLLSSKGIKCRYIYPGTFAEILCTYVLLVGLLQLPVRLALHKIKTVDAIDDDLL